MIKPLGHKSYGSIPHLPGSRLGIGDHHCSAGQAKIACVKKRDKHDFIIVQEKLDGSNCSVAKINGEIVALGRSGYEAKTSTYKVHHDFYDWVESNKSRFEALLEDGERVCGEYLGHCVGTRYHLPHEPYVPFDIMRKHARCTYHEFNARCIRFGFTTPFVISLGEPLSINEAMNLLKKSGHGAIDPVEGAVWRVERKGKVDFLCKYVRHDKEDGKYFAEKNEGIITYNNFL